MSFETLMAAAQRHNVSVEALAALAARLRADGSDGVALDPRVEGAVDAVVRAMGFDTDKLATLTADQRATLLGVIRSFFRQAADLIEHPERPPTWSYDDATILQSQGRASMALVPIIKQIAPALGDLEARLDRPGTAFLDVGTGVGWLAIAMARAFPNLRVVGIDVFDPSLRLAAGNIAPVRDRVELRKQDVARLDDEAAFDAVFLPGPFLPRHVVSDALIRVHASLRAGGWVLFGVYAPIDDPLSATLTSLRVVRSGGHPWPAEDVIEMLDRAGFRETRAFERAWQMPMTFVVGRR